MSFHDPLERHHFRSNLPKTGPELDDALLDPNDEGRFKELICCMLPPFPEFKRLRFTKHALVRSHVVAISRSPTHSVRTVQGS